MERSASIYGHSTVMRGVQLKIGEKFKPPAKITLPVGWKTRDPSELLSLTYDFSLEEDILEKAMAEKRVKEQQEYAQKAKEEHELLTKPVIACMGGDILQPTSAMSDKSLQKEQKATFNYKDFEGEADTPFELVELQSINNMDALKSVLQPSITPVVTSANNNIHNTECDGPNDQTDITLLGNIQTTRASNVHYPPTVNPNISPSGENIHYPPRPFPRSNLLNNQPTHINQEFRPDLNPFGTTDIPQSSNLNTPIPQLSTNNNTPLRTHLAGAMRVLPGPPPTKPLPQRPPPRRPRSTSSETTMDVGDRVVSAGNRPIPKPRSKLPPIKKDVDVQQVPPALPPKKLRTTQSYDYYKNPVPKDEKHTRRYSSPLPPISPPVTPITHSTTPDPLLSMSSDELQFARELSSMGFPLERVARAVKNFGCKEREVVEFLILFNEMCGQGHSDDQVEMVLIESDSDKEKAEKFLGLIVQFKELGFQEDQIFNALKESECDSNKTLDILTCAG